MRYGTILNSLGRTLLFVCRCLMAAISHKIPLADEISAAPAAKKMRLCTCAAMSTPRPYYDDPTNPNSCQLDNRNQSITALQESSGSGQSRAIGPDIWTWARTDEQSDCQMYGPENRTILFHPKWSNGTTAVRGNKPLNGRVTFWEIEVSHRLFGTSVMFGIGTSSAELSADSFLNLLGQDSHSYGLSHKGEIWQTGQHKQFCEPFVENQPVRVGMLFDGIKGTLSYFKDGQPLGVAFEGLHLRRDSLYPMVSSTAARTEMSLGLRQRIFQSLQDSCMTVVLSSLANNYTSRDDAKAPIDQLPITPAMKERLLSLMPAPEQCDDSCASITTSATQTADPNKPGWMQYFQNA